MASLFTADGRWVVESAGGSNTGRAEIIAHFTELPSKISWAQHYIINPRIELSEDGRSATGSFRLLCLCTIESTEYQCAGRRDPHSRLHRWLKQPSGG
ncbi:nuclear transport factor 2 family protein [Streptomyces sp. SD15]